MTQAEQMLAAARRLAGLGLAVHWLRGPKAGGKAPLAKEWQRAPYAPPAQVDEGWRSGCNLGVHTGLVAGAPRSVVVVDLDSPAALAWAQEHLPATPWRTLTRKGEHWYYLHPGAGVVLPNKAKVGKLALDIRGDGGNVVVAPSTHPEGHVYAEADPWAAGAELPTFDPAWFPAPPAPPPARPRSAPRTADEAHTRRRAAAWLGRVQPAISGQGGHDQLWDAAVGLCRGFGLAEGDALELLRLDYNPRCVPPWSDRELEHKVRGAAAAHSVPEGYLRDADRPGWTAPRGSYRSAAPPPPPMDEVPLDVREQDAPGEAADLEEALPAPGEDEAPRRPARRPEPQLPPDWTESLIWEGGRNPKLRRCLANAVTIFGRAPEWAGILAYNEFREQVEAVAPPPWGEDERSTGGHAAGPWADEDDIRATAWLERAHGLSLGRDTVAAAIRLAAERQRRFHPVREYLQGLRWDGEERLDLLFPWYFDAEAPGQPSPYLRLVSKWWTVSAVARIMDPGCKADSMVILEGKQGARKSSALCALAGRLEWFADSTVPLENKDAFEVLRGKWIIEFAELDSWRRADHNRLKNFLSSRQDTYRAAYARTAADHRRQCIFAGSTNEHDYLQDSTGGRRFWPVACGAIRLEELQRDRDQLWAEAVHLHRAGHRWWPGTDKETELCTAQQVGRYHGDEWEPKVALWLRDLAPVDLKAIKATGGLTCGVVLERALGIPAERWTKAHETRMGIILRHLGYERRQRRHDGGRSYQYVAERAAAPIDTTSPEF